MAIKKFGQALCLHASVMFVFVATGCGTDVGLYAQEQVDGDAIRLQTSVLGLEVQSGQQVDGFIVIESMTMSDVDVQIELEGPEGFSLETEQVTVPYGGSVPVRVRYVSSIDPTAPPSSGTAPEEARVYVTAASGETEEAVVQVSTDMVYDFGLVPSVGLRNFVAQDDGVTVKEYILVTNMSPDWAWYQVRVEGASGFTRGLEEEMDDFIQLPPYGVQQISVDYTPPFGGGDRFEEARLDIVEIHSDQNPTPVGGAHIPSISLRADVHARH